MGEGGIATGENSVGSFSTLDLFGGLAGVLKLFPSAIWRYGTATESARMVQPTAHAFFPTFPYSIFLNCPIPFRNFQYFPLQFLRKLKVICYSFL